MRIPYEWLTIRRQMVLIACAGLGFAMLVWLITPFRDRLPAWLLTPALRPRLVVANPVINIGTLPQMAKGRQTWVVKNSGPAPLRVRLEDQRDCGLAPCTLEQIQIEDQRGAKSSIRREGRRTRFIVPSGGRASLTMYWETRRTPGLANPYLDFATDDPKAPRLRLALIGTIQPSAPAARPD